MTMLEIKNLCVQINGKEILNGLSLTVKAGEVHAIMGPNGAGKSTLAHVLAGRAGYTVTGGQVIFDGKDLLALEPEERAAAGVFLAFQAPVELPPTMSPMKIAHFTRSSWTIPEMSARIASPFAAAPPSSSHSSNSLMLEFASRRSAARVKP